MKKLLPLKTFHKVVALLLFVSLTGVSLQAQNYDWYDSVRINPFGLSYQAQNGTPPDTTGWIKLVDIDNDGAVEAFMVRYESPYPPLACAGPCWWNVEYYENRGSTAAPDFEYVGDYPFGIPDTSLLPYQFVDMDADGDFDIFFAHVAFDHDIAYLENTGTPEMPDFSSPVSYNPFGLTPPVSDSVPGDILDNAWPVMVDIDDDGDFDMFYSGFFWDLVPFPPLPGSNKADEHYFFYENLDNSGGYNPSFSAPIKDPFGLKLTRQMALFFTTFSDMDCDGDWDMFTHFNPTFQEYRENTGTSQSPDFSSPPDTLSYDPATEPRPQGLVITFLGDWVDIGADGDMDFVGSEFGVPRWYENKTGGTDACLGPVEIIDFFSETNFSLYPNPARSQAYLSLDNDWRGAMEVKVYNTMGQELLFQNLWKSDQRAEWSLDLASLPSGFYQLVLTNGQQGVSRRLVRY